MIECLASGSSHYSHVTLYTFFYFFLDNHKTLDFHQGSVYRSCIDPKHQILHILCSSISSAQKVHAAALQSGFRESGISSINTSSLETSTAMVAVRTMGLAFDSVIGYEDSTDKLIPMVTESYMRILADIGNERFQVNKERTERFRSALFDAFRAPDSTEKQGDDGAWEPIEQRRARMREEGLRRKAEAQKAAKSAVVDAEGDNDDDALDMGMCLE